MELAARYIIYDILSIYLITHIQISSQSYYKKKIAHMFVKIISKWRIINLPEYLIAKAKYGYT